MLLAPLSFDDLGTPLSAVTFCVVDLETTGGSPADDAITEVGALKVLCGEVTGTFQTLVNPGRRVPAFVRLLTGISDEMLVEAPPVETVVPSFIEFLGGAVLVAHNARFDVSFLNAAMAAGGYQRIANRVVDTATLARKILAGEVPNNRLATLARHLRCAHQPCHRAFADVLATTDVLHHLIERVAGFGVTTLEDFLAVSSTRIDGTFSKIGMAQHLPRAPGVYRFVGTGGKTLYVGKAADLRTRVRSYFYGDPRRRIRDLLRETQDIAVETFPSLIEAEIAEARAIAKESPPYNRAGKGNVAWYLKVPTTTRCPRLWPTRAPKDDDALYLGPFGSIRTVRTLIDALRSALPIHRCSDPAKCRSCPFAGLGKCTGRDPDLHRTHMRTVAAAIVADPAPVLDALNDRMRHLSRQHRFEEAAETRAAAELLDRTLRAQAEARALIECGDLIVAHEGRALLIRAGQLAAAVDVDGRDLGDVCARLGASARAVPVGAYIPHSVHLQARVLCAWLRRDTQGLRILHVDGPLAAPARMGPRTDFR